ncbi:LysR family transcriptional regulator [Pseudomaricurvus alkylphenolicus]|uniref:LysR family transcriptional regulator n=1 Tax=Pseudomaricurvus alkylphenolicus TaxID=1306991 RepID=UPI001422F537|nr:LysR family transcriptional regulator [Pseudomaricurvus alkylphenolicus]NIB43531.1 LysR family transcriptional regulator [Pseudomaricurvus alkylphenolicus]
MDISDIAMLEAITKYGSISKASEILHVTQPTLSRRLSRLESQLATSLFLRSSNGLSPTDHTKFIIESSEPIKTKIQSIERHIELMNTLEAGELRIGVGPIVEQLYFPYSILQLTNSPTSNLNITIRTEKSDDLKQLLLEGLVDIAVGPFEESSTREEYQIFPIASQPLMIATRAHHPLVEKYHGGRPIPLDELFSFPLIAPHIPQYMIDQMEALKDLNASRIICDNYSIIKDVVERSDQVTIGPSAIFSEEVANGKIVLTSLPVPIRWYAACIALASNACLPVIRRIIDVFREYDLPGTAL